MEYLHYEAEDFLLDPSFQNYCLGSNPEDVHFWETWIAAHPEKRSVTELAQQLYTALNGNHTAARFKKDEAVFRAIIDEYVGGSEDGAAASQQPSVSEKSPVAVETFTDERGSGEKPFAIPGHHSRLLVRRIVAVSAAAAVFVFLVVSGLIKFRQPASQVLSVRANPVSPATHQCKAGEQKSVQLPDGSKVMLNAGSTFTIVKDFNHKSREILLDGEAFFDVAHDPSRPFIIHTASIDIKVLGTTFNVKAYSNDRTTETCLLKGSVEVIIKNKNNKKVLLRPNEKIVLPNGPAAGSIHEKPLSGTLPGSYRIAPLSYNVADSSLAEVSWTENRLAFSETTFEEIARQLERWYGISISFGDEKVKEYRFTATFDRKKITEILNALQLSRPFDYDQEQDGRIIIRSGKTR